MRKLNLRICLTLIVITFTGSHSWSQFSSISEKDRNEIILVMTTQQQAWNSGDIEAFMEGYWNSDSLLFVGATGPLYGWDTTLKNYLQRYPDRTAMGELNFDINEIKGIGEHHARLLGRFYLKRTVGDISGYFTLLFYHFPDGWKIISDQTSAGNN